MTTIERPRVLTDELDAQIIEYQHLRSYGLANHEIAERLGTTWEAFTLRLRRANIELDTRTPTARHQHAVLDRLIASGVPFTADALPFGDDNKSAQSIVAAANRLGRIVKVGSRRVNGSSLGVWQGVTEGGSV
ncbi:hypothetical protein [Rhodococcoides fascians]|uniref:hypothetical protein n=1 Tax=Rhodococcoides fascians TaxID=1828 RepID=UPI000565F3D4|nr:hypothetical protein [Rhodococcus fascians]